LNKEKKLKIQQKLESITQKWWCFLFFILLQFLPSYTSIPTDPSQMGLVIGEALSNALVYNLQSIFFVFKIIPLVLILTIPFPKNKVTRVFSFYAAISYVLFATLQSIAVTESYGIVIVLTNFIMFLIVAIFWFWETLVQKNSFSSPTLTPLTLWVIPLAVLAFWYPLNTATMMPDFNPIGIIANEAGLAFCMMTPVYLAILIIYYPNVNIATLRITSIVGVIIGFYNFLLNFMWYYESLFWNGIFHIPLIMISIYAAILSYGKARNEYDQ
jgi:hypothetical protein